VELPLRTQRAGAPRSGPQRSLALADRQTAIIEELRAELEPDSDGALRPLSDRS